MTSEMPVTSAVCSSDARKEEWVSHGFESYHSLLHRRSWQARAIALAKTPNAAEQLASPGSTCSGDCGSASACQRDADSRADAGRSSHPRLPATRHSDSLSRFQVPGDHAHSALTDLRRELVRLLHGSIFSRVGASSKPRAIQMADQLVAAAFSFPVSTGLW